MGNDARRQKGTRRVLWADLVCVSAVALWCPKEKSAFNINIAIFFGVGFTLKEYRSVIIFYFVLCFNMSVSSLFVVNVTMLDPLSPLDYIPPYTNVRLAIPPGAKGTVQACCTEVIWQRRGSTSACVAKNQATHSLCVLHAFTFTKRMPASGPLYLLLCTVPRHHHRKRRFRKNQFGLHVQSKCMHFAWGGNGIH